MKGRRGLVVVTRAPGSAGAKTRLAETVGSATCERLQAAFLADTLLWAEPLAEWRLVSVFPPAETESVADRAGEWAVAAQRGPDFGERMRGAVNDGFGLGAAPVAMIASDSPTLPDAVLEEGWRAVERDDVDVALAPADDGGWVMIAAAAPLPGGCFAGVRWSTPETLRDTVAALRAAGLRVTTTAPWYDVDTADDLRRLEAELKTDAAQRLPATATALKPIAG